MMDFIILYYNVTIKTAYSIEDYFIPCKQGGNVELATNKILYRKLCFCDSFEVVKVEKATPQEVQEHKRLYNSLTEKQKADLIAGFYTTTENLKGAIS